MSARFSLDAPLSCHVAVAARSNGAAGGAAAALADLAPSQNVAPQPAGDSGARKTRSRKRPTEVDPEPEPADGEEDGAGQSRTRRRCAVTGGASGFVAVKLADLSPENLAEVFYSEPLSTLVKAGAAQTRGWPPEVWLRGAAFWRPAHADHFLLRSEAGNTKLDAALGKLVALLARHGLLTHAREHGEFYGAELRGPAQTPSEPAYRLPALLASIAPARDALPCPPQPAGLALPLFPYQRQAVHWMTTREAPDDGGECSSGVLSPLWDAWRLPDGRSLYCNVLTGTCSLDKPLAPSRTLLRGGILADAMGLGKTAMLAALILARPFDPAVPDTSANGQLMLQRAAKHMPTRVKATLVVVTQAIEAQWVAELRRWAPGLKVARFPADFIGSSNPAARAVRVASSHDVVVTTYDDMTLMARDGLGPGLAKAMREEISWWRVVLDEAQTVFNAASAPAKCTSWLWKSNVWCTSGTPLSNDLMDLHGLLEMLDSDPFANETCLKRLVVDPYRHREPGAHARVRALLRQICLRREADAPEVLEATKLAKPTWVQPKLCLSAAEALRYQRAYRAVYRAADAELKALHERELAAESRLRGWAVREARTRVRTSATAAAAARMQAAQELAATMGFSLEDGKALVADYCAMRVHTRMYDDRQQYHHQRVEEDAPSAAERTRIRAVPAAVRTLLDDADVAAWNAEQDVSAVQFRIDEAENSDAANRWRNSLQGAEEWLAGEDYDEEFAAPEDEDGGAAPSEAARARGAPRRAAAAAGAAAAAAAVADEEDDAPRRRRNPAALIGGADELRGTPALRAAVTQLRRMLCHPSIAPPATTATGAAAIAAAAKDASLDFAQMLEEAKTQVTSLERDAADADAALAAAGGVRGALASASEYVRTRLDAARVRLGFLTSALAAMSDRTCCVCLEEPGKGDASRAVLALPCLHPACDTCLKKWMRESPQAGCPVCRGKVERVVSLTTARRDAATGEQAAAARAAATAACTDDLVIRHGTKLAYLVRDVRARLAVHPAGAPPFRCVIFSAWDDVLALIAAAFLQAGLPAACGFGREAASEVTRFRDGAASTAADAPVALLLPLRGAAKSAAAGVNLQMASVAYLFDPCTEAGLEAQAVGRIARIGQTAPVVVVRLMLRASLEEDVLRLQRSLGSGRGGGAGGELVTGEDLALLFGITGSNPHAASGGASGSRAAHAPRR